MFVRDFIHVARPFQTIAPQFLRDPGWLRPIIDDAVCEAATVARALAGSPEQTADQTGNRTGDPTGDSAGNPARDGASSTVLDRGAVRTRTRGLVVPISWSNRVDLSWFPPISGDLEIAPIGLSRSELVLSASYQSPEVLEPPADRPLIEPTSQSALVHRVVETGVRAFLQNLAVALETGPAEIPRP